MTPLKDKWKALLASMNKETRYTDPKELKVGDYALIGSTHGRGAYEGEVLKIGPKNVTISSPYGGWGDSDFSEIMELKFPKVDITSFVKPLPPVQIPK